MDLAQFIVAVRAGAKGRKSWPVLLKSTAGRKRSHAPARNSGIRKWNSSTEKILPCSQPLRCFPESEAGLRDWHY
jgi:hypothetical protein